MRKELDGALMIASSDSLLFVGYDRFCQIGLGTVARVRILAPSPYITGIIFLTKSTSLA